MREFEKPPHTIQVRRELNDTPIPGLSIDYDTMTLSCDWRGLFSAFFAEELLVHNLQDRAMEKFQARRDTLIEDVHAGRMDMVDALQQVLKIYEDESHKARKLARQARIRWQYEQEGYASWKPEEEEEDRINEVLKKRIFFASAASFSDKEDGGGDEDAEDEDGGDDSVDQGNEGEPVGQDVDANVSAAVQHG
jgi:hypothetical protein